MSRAASAIDEIQKILATPTWDGGTIELVGQALERHGFDSWAKSSIRENRYLKQQFFGELVEAIEEAINQWDVEQLGMEVTHSMIFTWAATIVTNIIDQSTEA